MEPDAATVRLSSTHQLASAVMIVSPTDKDRTNQLQALVRRVRELLTAGVHLLVIDLIPPGPLDPDGVHPLIWDSTAMDVGGLPPSKLLSCVAYKARSPCEAYLETIPLNDSLPDMPLFLTADMYVPVPLESTYQSAFAAVPGVWREVLEAPPAG